MAVFVKPVHRPCILQFQFVEIASKTAKYWGFERARTQRDARITLALEIK